MRNALLVFISITVLSWIVGWLIHPLLKKWGLVDVPNQRSSHTRVTLRGGGLGIVLSIWVGAIWMLWRGQSYEMAWLLLASLPVSAVSLWDDIKSLSVKIRLLVHLIAGIVVVFAFSRLWEKTSLPALLLLALFVFWIVAYTNAFNFMDGINGMAGFQGVTTGLGTAIIVGVASGNWGTWECLLPLIIAAAAAGFLPHNFPKARMFMGDIGSVSMGFLLASLVFVVAIKHGFGLIAPLLLLHTNFILDTGVTRFRLFLRGGQWYGPHREHFYQRLTRAGQTHAFVSLMYALGQCLTLAGAVMLVVSPSNQLRFITIALVLALWSVLFLFCEKKFKAVTAQPTS